MAVFRSSRLVKARQVSLVVQTEPRNVRYWLDKIDKSISSLGYRESQVVRDAGDLRRYLPTIPNFLLPHNRRGPSQLRPFVPRWSRWKENELEISWIQEDERPLEFCAVQTQHMKRVRHVS